ncbi:MAG: hypothetical protein J6P64_07260 [Bacteroidales bacterium]|nr:hypothetical protein [Bacteroidales bacterium]
MKKGTKLKAFMLSLIMTALLLPMTSFAQQTSDSFFCVDDAFNGNRDVFAFNGLHNQTFGDAPLGSGLLVLGALGAGYAIARRKRNKKGAALLLALALTLGFTQCKKKVEQVVPVNANKVNITLNVDGRHIVTPGAENATVTYEDGDKIYVGDGTHYIGTLTRASGAFSGEIVEPTDGTKIDFFFVGGLEPSVTPTASTTTDFTVNISNQSSNLPVLSCGSAEYYHGTTEYNSELKNKCALVELTLTSGTTDAVGIGDRYTQATINFGSTPGIVPNTTTTGMVTTKSESATKKYAIILPQAAVAGSHIAIGHVGYTLDIPAINANDYAKLSNSSAVASNIVYLNYLTANYTAADGQTLTGTLGANVKISIADGATVTLDGVSINASGTWTSGNYAGITCVGNATIILSGTNTVKGFDEDYPGIQAAAGKTLTINGTGSLTASSNGYSAGIGGGSGFACGNIEIQGGTITATGGERGAGIGGAYNASWGNITISGGTVTATGGEHGAGIGGGRRFTADVSCGNITISGGTVTATGGDDAAGIGGGRGNNNLYKSSCGTITITTGVTIVTATKGSGATNSIGAGNVGTCGTVTIGGVEGAITTSPYTYPVPLTYPIALGDATSDYVGSVVTTDGYVYATVDAASAASKTAVAVIAYVGTAGSVDASSATYKGLAIALSDANSGSNCKWAEDYANCLSSSQTSDITIALGFKNGISCTNTLTGDGHTHAAATAAAINNGTAAPTGTSGWFMPSMGQWNLIVQGLATKKAGSAVTTDLTYQTDNPTYKADNLNSVITDAGGTGFQKNSYWASTEQTLVRAWAIYFTNGYATNYAKIVNYYVRSVIAF